MNEIPDSNAQRERDQVFIGKNKRSSYEENRPTQCMSPAYKNAFLARGFYSGDEPAQSSENHVLRQLVFGMYV